MLAARASANARRGLATENAQDQRAARGYEHEHAGSTANFVPNAQPERPTSAQLRTPHHFTFDLKSDALLGLGNIKNCL